MTLTASSSWPAEAYHGASKTRQSMRAWNPSRGSADRNAIQEGPILGRRGADLYRNVPVARAAVLTMTTNVVGLGLHVQPQLDTELLGIEPEAAEAWEKRARALFHLCASSKNMDAERKQNFYQLQDLALRTRLVGGDCFGLLPLRYNPGWPFALCVKLLGAERCRNPNTAPNTDRLAGGIEVDDYGAPVAYHFTRAPVNGFVGDLQAQDTVRVPAFGEVSGRPLVLHLFEQEEPDQRRGVSWLAPVVDVIKQQGRYQDAEIMAAVVQGMYTVFVTTESGAPEWEGNATATEKEQAGIAPDKSEVAMKYGGVVDLRPGEKIETANPSRPNPNYEPFVNSIFREIGAALGVPYETMLKYFSSSYTAARAAFLEGWKTFKRGRMDLQVDFCQPVYEAALAEFISLGLLEAPGFWDDPLRKALWCSAEWVGDAPGQLNPVMETEAMKMAVDEHFKSRSTATMELTGGDHFRVAEELTREKAHREKLGLPEPGGVQKTESVSVQSAGGPTRNDNPGGGVPDDKDTKE